MLKQGIKRSLKLFTLFLFLALFLVACDDTKENGQPSEKEESYSLTSFMDQVNYPNDQFAEVMGHYEALLSEHPVQPFSFESDQAQSQNNVTEILNNFNPGPKAQHSQVGENEEYLFYEFGQADGESEQESKQNFIGLYFVNGALVQAGIFTDQQDLPDEAFLDASTVNEKMSADQTLADLGQAQPTLLAYSQMNFDGMTYHLPAVASLTETGGQMIQLPLYDQDYNYLSSDIMGLQYLQAASINNTLINRMLTYYTEDILGVESTDGDQSQMGGSLMDYEDFQSSSQAVEEEARQATEDAALTLDRVTEIMGEPMNQGAGAVNYQSQNSDGAVETFTVVFDDSEQVTNVSRQLQSNQLEFPFDEENLNALSYMEVTTPIESIEEQFTKAHYKEYNLESGDTVYMWTKDDPEAAINVVQIIYGPDGTISGVAFDGNQEEK